jgi:hypothetical protein
MGKLYAHLGSAREASPSSQDQSWPWTSRETDPRSQSHRNQTSERAWETLADWPSNSGITPPYAADRESRLPSRCPILWDQNSAFPGVRGNGITSRILTMPVT